MTKDEFLIEVAGFELEVIKWGDHKPKWFFVHGFGGNALSFSKVIEPLVKKGDGAISISLPFHGKSANAKESQLFDIEKLGKGLNVLLEKQFGMDSYALVSHSLGSRVILWMATHRPEKVRSVHIMNPAGFYPIEIYFFSWFKKGWASKLLETQWFPKLMTSYLISNPSERHINTFIWLSKSFDVMDLVRTKVFIQLFKIKQTVHIYWGDRDRFLPQKYAYEVRQHFTDAEVHMIENCGHLPMVEYPYVIADLLSKNG